MTKEEIDRQYSENCLKIGDLEMHIARVKMTQGELEVKKERFMTANRNLAVDMDKLMKEEARAAAAKPPAVEA